MRGGERESLKPEIRVGVSLPASALPQFFSLFAARTTPKQDMAAIVVVPRLLLFAPTVPLSVCLPVFLPVCLSYCPSACVRLFVALLISANHRESHCSGGFRSIPNDQSSHSQYPHSTYSSSTPPPPNNSLPDALSFFFLSLLSGAICKLPTWGSVEYTYMQSISGSVLRFN